MKLEKLKSKKSSKNECLGMCDICGKKAYVLIGKEYFGEHILCVKHFMSLVKMGDKEFDEYFFGRDETMEEYVKLLNVGYNTTNINKK